MNLYNPYILIPLLTWAIAQLAKFLVAAIRSHNRFDLRYLYASGGMPSAHSAVVCSLAITALLRSGLTSPIFGLSAVFAAIVMYDSFGVRRSVGEQATVINAILDNMSRQRLGLDHPQQRLREILGHKPLEVSVGALAGVALGLLFNASFLSHQITWLTSFASRTEAIIYLSLSLATILIGLALALGLRRYYRDSKIIQRLSRNLLIATSSIGLVGLALSFADFEKALYLGWRLWLYLVLAAAIVWKLILIGIFAKLVPAELARENEAQRLRKWLPGKRRAKRRG